MWRIRILHSFGRHCIKRIVNYIVQKSKMFDSINSYLFFETEPYALFSFRSKLSEVFNVVQEVNILDSKDEANLKLLKRPELGVTFTKLHCWRLTQFDKCVFLDADTLVCFLFLLLNSWDGVFFSRLKINLRDIKIVSVYHIELVKKNYDSFKHV